MIRLAVTRAGRGPLLGPSPAEEELLLVEELRLLFPAVPSSPFFRLESLFWLRRGGLRPESLLFSGETIATRQAPKDTPLWLACKCQRKW